MWHIDITYIPIGKKFAYLITVLDGYSRHPVNYELCLSMTEIDTLRVVNGALKKAGIMEEENMPVLISGHGSQLTVHSFRDFLKDIGKEHRFIAVGNPEANGKIEVFHKTIKYEHIYVQKSYENYYEAKRDIDKFMKYYSEERLHQGIDYVTPKDKYEGRDELIISRRKFMHKLAIQRRKEINKGGKAALSA